MKVNFSFKKIIVQLFISIFFFTIYSCDSCKRQGITRGQEEGLVELSTTGIATLGSINTSQLVVALTGEITKNLITETSQVVVLIIPHGAEIEKATKEFRAVVASKPLDKDTRFISLPDVKGIAYYSSDMAAGKNGTVQEKIFLDGLDPENYKAYLILHNKEHGTYYSTEGQPITVLDPTLAPAPPAAPYSTINLQDTNALRKINASNVSFIEISADANVTNHIVDMQGGFVFIEKDAPNTTTIEKFIASYITNSSILPTTSEFKKSANFSSIIVHSFAGNVQESNNLIAEDTDNVFRKGATYQVYAYTVDTNSNYTISSEDKEITIPSPEVELEMKEARITKMIYDVSNPPATTSANLIELELKGEIKKHGGTTAPIVGYLLTQNPLGSPEEGMQKVTELLKEPNKNGWYKKPTSTDFVCTNNTSIANNLTGESLARLGTSDLPMALLDTKYHIYFWLKDGEDVFISDPAGGSELHIPKAEIIVHKYETRYEATMFGLSDPLQVIPQVTPTGYDKEYKGFLLVREKTPPIAIDPIQVFGRILADAVVRSDINNTNKDTNGNLTRSEKDPSAALTDIGSNSKEVLYYWRDKEILEEVESKLDMQDSVKYKIWPWYTTITEKHNSIFYKEILETDKFFECFTYNHKTDVISVTVPHGAAFAAGLGLVEDTIFEVSNPESETTKQKIDTHGENSRTYFIRRVQPDNINPLLDITDAEDEKLIKVILENRFYRGRESSAKTKKYMDFMRIAPAP